MDELPFAGCRVLDLSQGVAGPHATMLMALNGADVIKIEPLEGDWCRRLGSTRGDSSVNFEAFNRGKRSLAIDLKSSAGKTVIHHALEHCDIVVESFRPGVVKRLGVDFECVRRVQPQCIYASISGFGQAGPESRRAAVDSLIQAYSGMMTMNAAPDGTPHRAGMIIVDVVTGLYAYQAIAAAFIGRLRWGRGALLDVSMMQSAAAFQAAKIMEFWESGGAPQPLYVPAGSFRTADGHIAISGMKKEHFESICRVLGVPRLAADPRWPGQQDRLAHGSEINAVLAREFEKRTVAYWLPLLADAGVMAERVRSYGEWLKEPQVIEANAVEWSASSPFGQLPLACLPGVPHSERSVAAAPALGQHSVQLLEQMGMTTEWIAEHQACGSIILHIDK